VLLTAIRRDKFYIPDPVDGEMIAIPDCLLADCNGLSLDGGDCDDLAAALAAAIESIGIPCAIVGQAFEGDPPVIQHVLVAVEASPGLWFYADPSEEDMPLGIANTPTWERWVLVPTGEVLCDRGPTCLDQMQGVVARTDTRVNGDLVGVGLDRNEVERQPGSEGSGSFWIGAIVGAAATALLVGGVVLLRR